MAQSTLTQLAPDALADYLDTQQLGHGAVRATVLHHTWKPRAWQYQGRETIAAIRQFHVQSRGWSDIGANFYACPDSTVFTGRPLSRTNWAHALVTKDYRSLEPAVQQLAGHNVQWFNHYALGVETVADFDNESLAEDQPAARSLETALQVLAAVHAYYNLPVSRLFFHRDVSRKSCPGAQLDRTDIRRRLNMVLTGGQRWGDGPLQGVILMRDGEQVNYPGLMYSGQAYVHTRALEWACPGADLFPEHIPTQRKLYVRLPTLG